MFFWPKNGIVEHFKSSTVLNGKRGTDGDLLASESLFTPFVTWLSEDFFRYHENKSSVAQYCSEVSSPQSNDPGPLVPLFTTLSMFTPRPTENLRT